VNHAFADRVKISWAFAICLASRHVAATGRSALRITDRPFGCGACYACYFFPRDGGQVWGHRCLPGCGRVVSKPGRWAFAAIPLAARWTVGGLCRAENRDSSKAACGPSGLSLWAGADVCLEGFWPVGLRGRTHQQVERNSRWLVFSACRLSFTFHIGAAFRAMSCWSMLFVVKARVFMSYVFAAQRPEDLCRHGGSQQNFEASESI